MDQEGARYPTPPLLSPEEVARRRAASRRIGRIIAALCIVVAVVAALVMLSLDPGDDGAAGPGGDRLGSSRGPPGLTAQPLVSRRRALRR